MLKRIEEYGKYVEISGFRNATIADAPKFLSALHEDLPEDVEVQLLDADMVASWQHLYFAVLNALMAHKTKRSISKSLAVETALYASAQRQIKKAIAAVGVKPDCRNVAAIVIGENPDSARKGLYDIAQHLGVQPDEKVLELSDAKVQRIRSAFGISDTELEATTVKDDAEQTLVDLVIERVALLSTQL
jgi:tRNA threonylcarbamoyladenosine modification (KEOPS) complex Cgi121 subunit